MPVHVSGAEKPLVTPLIDVRNVVKVFRDGRHPEFLK
jgi:hypothetical protein